MLEVWIKYAFIIVCAMYSYRKLLHLQPSGSGRRGAACRAALSAAGLTACTVLLRVTVPAVSLLGMAAVSIPVFRRLSMEPLPRAAACTILAYGVSYGTLAAVATLSAVLEALVLSLLDIPVAPIWRMLTAGVLQLCATLLLFQMKRLKHGLVFLVDSGSSDVGVSISVAILVTASLLGINQDAHLAYLVLTFFFLFSGITLWLWWKDRTAAVYRKELYLREIQELNQQLEEKNSQLERLRQENERLAAILHRDNKQLPAASACVRDFLRKAGRTLQGEACASAAAEVLEHLEAVIRDRQTALRDYAQESCQTPDTGSGSIDVTLRFMAGRAAQAGIEFQSSIPANLPLWMEDQVREEDLNTLLADLLENAIIATSSSPVRRMLLQIAETTIDVYDSGAPFPPEVLVSFGLRRMTGHPEDGGSGIGLENTYRLCQTYNASFVLEEYGEDRYYTKRVSVCFDGLGQYRLKLPDSARAKAVSVNPKALISQ